MSEFDSWPRVRQTFVKAKMWAENPEDEEVEPGKFSSLHHSAKADASAVSAAASADEAAAHFADVIAEERYRFVSITWDADDVIQSATVLWADGSEGVFTTTSIDSTHLAINGYTVTHADSGQTLTQPAVTRDANGNIITVPPATIS